MPLITPEFFIEQDEKHIIIKLRLPYVKPTKSEFSMIGKQFSFYLKPYLLQLTFNEFLKDAEQPAKAIYDPETYYLKVYLEKLNAGEHFTELDMIGLLLNKKSKKNKQFQGKLIQVIESTNDKEEGQNIDQNPEDQLQGYVNPFCYGFNNQYKDVFDDLEEELYEIAILDPKQIAMQDRKSMALQYVQQQFDKDAYLFDLFENEQVDEVLVYEFQFQKQFTIDEINKISKLGKREYLIENKEICLFGIIDILFAYLYENNLFQGDLNQESAITINQLSSQFQAFYIDNNLENILINNYQRALTFPMIRSFEICVKTKNLLVEILENKINIIKILVAVEGLFSKAKPRNYLNLIYVQDYIVWAQNLKEDELKNLSKQLKQLQINKSQLQLNIPEIEHEALQQFQE
ncbi:unnamed protein product (macronuclear) [Paramecium tetraurelia]|uniref:Uncharacterized protein n=1 Tax=Paramecium tetraurelia TaxID=5888 RepID=A0DFG4_PARTE|nr:uncharacterized protein GSPATT00016594001 [Paramecium tetraurelia]CAK81781.1 unnamed protein product [Paramecium tetraurelia]|eukprot:XP_001449178.1 hypothetical protein (macronuclear) [Paramecium tetraurelia strain d4-2]